MLLLLLLLLLVAEAGLDEERQLAAQYLTLIPWCRLLYLAVGVPISTCTRDMTAGPRSRP